MKQITKKCIKCGAIKSEIDFPLYSSKEKWRMRSCRDCYIKQFRKKRENHRQQYRNYAKKYYDKNKSVILKRCSDYKKHNQLKSKARRMVDYAIEIGKIIRGNCSICGAKNAQAHHEDYFKPLDIIWLCDLHHKRLHAENHK